ncbi:MAG: catalase [Spirochaetia bacterium]|nr:catalase [Spirochaetia bacterium]
MKSPSTNWREEIAPDEAERFQQYAEDFKAIQRLKSKAFGRGRTLHRKQLLAMRAELKVVSGLPNHARHGIFAKENTYDCWIRLSNGGLDIKPDSAPDIRGFAIKVLGVSGPNALGSGSAKSQDFLLINHDAFSSPKSDEFMGVVKAASKGNGALIGYLIKKYGFFKGLKRVKLAADMFGKPFSGFATERFNTAVPISCGPYAVKVGLEPASSQPTPGAKKDWAADMRARLEKGPLVHDLQLQFFVDEATTPIENAAGRWSETESPFLTVAKLTIPQQKFDTPEAKKLTEDVEAAAFDPWGGLIEHRPLGDVMRARRYVYFASQQGRA